MNYKTQIHLFFSFFSRGLIFKIFALFVWPDALVVKFFFNKMCSVARKITKISQYRQAPSTSKMEL